MKKGFSLVEVMVVMVVIGIVVALGIKGSALVNTSRIRAEIAKLRNFETGFASYFLKNNSLPPKDGDNTTPEDNFTCYNVAPLLTRQVVVSEDLPSAFSQGSKDWLFATDIAVDNGTHAFAPMGFDVENVGAYAVGLNYELICNIEGILDDGNALGGVGRALTTPIAPLSLVNCDEPSNKNQYIGYIYVAFSPNSLIPEK
jgi:prepilin-type N-terminal cleavage/methylation domain-containing protein